MAYTRHGHRIPNTNEFPIGERPAKARCGGLRFCAFCKVDAEEFYKAPDGMIEFDGPPRALDGEDARKILGVVFNWIFEEGIAHKEDLQDRLQDAGYGMSKVETKRHYRK